LSFVGSLVRVYCGEAAVPADESEGESCLHCEINDLVREHIDGQGETVDVTEVAARVAESLVDLILLAPEQEQGKLFAATIAYLGRLFVGESGDGENGQGRTH
jgi:hypothetical protein